MSEKVVQITYYATEETRKQLRTHAAETGKNITAIIDEAVKVYLATNKS